MASIRQLSRRVALSMLLSLVLAVATATAQTTEGCVRVTILQVNDVYQFMPVDQGTRGGLERVLYLRKKIAQDAPNMLLLLSGDTISPSVESIKLKGEQMIFAWNTIGLDYATLGNHEFDFGPDELMKRIRESKFKWIAANVMDKNSGGYFGGIDPFVIREFQGVKVGLFGILLPETMTTSSPGKNVLIRQPCEAAREIVPKMRAKGAQVVVAITHLAMKQDKELAHCVPDIDLIIGGHEHTLLQSLAGRTPIFKMTADARELGRFDLNIDARSGKLQSVDWKVIPVTQDLDKRADFAALTKEFAAVTDKYKEQLATYNEVVGRTTVELDAGSESNRTGETNVSDFITDTFRKAYGADVALINGGSIRADTVYQPGTLSKHDVLAILPFGGEIMKIQVTGATLRRALEHGVSQSGPGAEPGNFPQVSGLRFSYDTSLPPGARVKKVTVGGQPLDDTRTYTLATSAYLIGGGAQYTMFKGARTLTKPGEVQTDTNLLMKAISSVESIAPQTDGRIERLNQPAKDTQNDCNLAPVEKK